jgi:hypothetical protein
MLHLLPNQSVTVKLPVQFALLEQWIKEGAKEIKIRAACSEWKISDNEFRIAAISDEVVSDNIIKAPF